MKPKVHKGIRIMLLAVLVILVTVLIASWHMFGTQMEPDLRYKGSFRCVLSQRRAYRMTLMSGREWLKETE